MSRQPSPTPSSHLQSTPQMPRANWRKPLAPRASRAPRPLTPKSDVVAQHTPSVATSSSTRNKNRAYPSGITANAEDAKYAAKYRALKIKVKEIEMRNDRLYYKVLQAKKNIQRARLERAILYERLGAISASPIPGQASLAPQAAPQHVSAHPQQVSQEHRQSYSGPPQNSQASHRNQHQVSAQMTPSSQAYMHNHQVHPAPLRPLSPHHSQSHHISPPAAPKHSGQLPITHAQQICTVNTPDGPLAVVAGPDGRPVYTQDGHYIPVEEPILQHPAVNPSSHPRRRSVRVSAREKESFEREARERELREAEYGREMRDSESNPMFRIIGDHEDERTRDHDEEDRRRMHIPGIQTSVQTHPDSLPHSSSSSRPHSAHVHGISPPLVHPGVQQINVSSSRDHREHEIDRQREYDQERERRDREVDRERGRHATILDRSEGHFPQQHPVHHHPHDRDVSPPVVLGAVQVAEIASAPQTTHAGHRSYSHGSHSLHYSHGQYPSHEPIGGQGGYRPRIHNHQRIGPGSNAARDSERREREKERLELSGIGSELAARLKHEDDHEEGVLSAPSFSALVSTVPVPSSTRVPTPPYMIRSHAEREIDIANHANRAHDALEDSR